MARVNLKEQIIIAGLSTFQKRGFNGCSVQDIASAAAVPKGSFYNHFASKEDLAIETLNRHWQDVETTFGILTDKRVPPLARLRGYFHYLNEIARANEYKEGCFIGNMCAEMSNQSDSIREQLTALMTRWSQAIETCVREAQSDGSMRQEIASRSVAAFLINAWEGAMMRAKVDRSHVPLADFEKVAFATLVG